MQLRTWLALTLGGLLMSILIVSSAGSIATIDLTGRIGTLDQAATLARHLDKIERARRQYQASGSADQLKTTRNLVGAASLEISKLKAMSDETDDQAPLILRLEGGFARYQRLLDAYSDSELRKVEANANMAAQLGDLRAMASKLKTEKEADYHRSFAVATSLRDVEERLKTTLRLTALANEIIVLQMSIERSVVLFLAGNQLGATGIHLEIGQVAEIADRIRRIEQVAAGDQHDVAALSLPDQLAASSNHFQAAFDDFRVALRDQTTRAEEMADVAIEVTQLIQSINSLQTVAAVQSADWTLALSFLGVATALVLGGGAALVIRNRIIRPLSAITKAMQQMSTGLLGIDVPGHARRDELGAMARALEVLRKNSLEARRLADENLIAERNLAAERAEAAALEQSLERERELNAQQRRFVALVSHEFRTPLAIIDGQAQRLIRRGDRMATDQRLGSLEKVRSAVHRLTDFMESVLSSASLEAGAIAFDPTSMNLRSLIQKACEGQQEFSTTHKINVNIDGLPETFLGDPKLLIQVAANLLSNAVKYSPNANHVDVTGRLIDDGVEIAFRDFGVGIPIDELPNLSRRFFRASTSAGIQGTGIGLNLVKALIEMHDGVMEVVSTLGEGSTFIVKLPHRQPADNSIAAA